MVEYEKTLKYKLKEVDWAQAVYVSATSGQRVPKARGGRGREQGSGGS